MKSQLIQTIQAIAALGSIILLSGAIVLLVVQFLKDLLNLEGDSKKRAIQLLAVAVGLAWGLMTMRLPASLIWPDLPASAGGLLIGLLSGMSAIGGKSFTNGAIDRAASARVEAVKSSGLNLPQWSEMWQQGLQSLQQQPGSFGPGSAAPAAQPDQPWQQPPNATQTAQAPGYPVPQQGLQPVNAGSDYPAAQQGLQPVNAGPGYPLTQQPWQQQATDYSDGPLTLTAVPLREQADLEAAEGFTANRTPTRFE